MKGQELDFLNFLSLRSELNPSLKTIVSTFPGEGGGISLPSVSTPYNKEGTSYCKKIYFKE